MNPATPRNLPRRAALLQALLAAFALAFALFSPSHALAAGTVTLENREPEEVNGRWKLNFKFNYGKAPDVAYVPMIFSFTMTTLYERSLTDQSGEKPVLTRKPLQNQVPINESMDVGFSNAEGKIFPTTKFDIPLRRDKGYEAGEYDLKITRASDGAQMGTTLKIVLKGDNEIIDRRAIVFSGEKKKKKEDKPAEGEQKKEGEANATSDSNTSTESAATEDKPVETPPPVEPKKGGCGCRVAGVSETNSAAFATFATLALGLGVFLRKRSRRA